MKNFNISSPTTDKKIAKVLAMAMYFSALAAIYCAAFADGAMSSGEWDQVSINQNISRGFVVATFVLGMFLKSLQKNVYALFGRHKPLDERQQQVRSSAFEKSYMAIITILLISMFVSNPAASGHTHTINQWLLVSAILNLPSMLAAFRKNS